MAPDIKIETRLPDPPDVVWRALTDPKALSEWLMPVEGFRRLPGHLADRRNHDQTIDSERTPE